MKMLKWIFIPLLCLVLIIAGVSVFFLSNINRIVEDAVETVGPKVTETRVDIQSVDIQLLKGGGEFNNLVIDNPPGYKSPYLFESKKLAMEIDPKSIQNKVVVINKLDIQGVKIVAEQKGLTTNIQTLLKTLSKQQSSGSAQTESVSDSGASDVLLALKHLNFSGSSIQLITEKYGEYTVTLPEFQLNNIGSPEKGLTPEEFGAAMLKPLMKQAQKAVEKRIEQEAKKQFEKEVEDKLEDEVSKKVNQELGEGASEKAEKTFKELKGLFK